MNRFIYRLLRLLLQSVTFFLIVTALAKLANGFGFTLGSKFTVLTLPPLILVARFLLYALARPAGLAKLFSTAKIHVNRPTPTVISSRVGLGWLLIWLVISVWLVTHDGDLWFKALAATLIVYFACIALQMLLEIRHSELFIFKDARKEHA